MIIVADKDKEKSPKFESAVFFVEDVKRSKEFYANTLGQKIIMDFGRNVGFEGGFAIWEKDYALNTIYSEEAKNVSVGGNNAEIYYESSDLDDLCKKLKSEEITFIHPIHEHPWGQRAFRIFDPDNHIIEFGEPMSIVVIRYFKQGMTIEEISKKTLMPIEMIKNTVENSE
jgi:catechol 2,3-dioxygenase-like lactoylglutathione lyase family enzyme